MQVFQTIHHFHAWRNSQSPTLQIGLVPTMGALHEGHLSLVHQSVQAADLTVVTIFVNPTQFGPNEDLDKYPRQLDQDLELLKAAGVDVVLAPDVREVYADPAHLQISFQIKSLDKVLCGASRPGHMNGVLQVVSILFHLVRPQLAFFGAKDYQQFLLIRQMVRELHFPLEVIPCPIVREKDGLAMSSRNVYLGEEERKQALALYRSLQLSLRLSQEGASPMQVRNLVLQGLEAFPLVRLDYFELLSGETLEPIEDLFPTSYPHAFIAAYLGKTRLIDNLALYP
ncbi:MAG: pantoate--beta-alanine ligase [Bacteroidota bacterium]